jgi:Transposase
VVTGLKHQKEKRSMDHFAGLDVSVNETSVCIVDDSGKIVREVKVPSEPEALLAVLKKPAYTTSSEIGLEAGPLSQWLYSALAEAELPVVCVETRHMQAVLKAQINKTDRNDARGIAQMMRVGLYRPVHVKTLRSQKLRMLLTHRKLLLSKAIDTSSCSATWPAGQVPLSVLQKLAALTFDPVARCARSVPAPSPPGRPSRHQQRRKFRRRPHVNSIAPHSRARGVSR